MLGLDALAILLIVVLAGWGRLCLAALDRFGLSAGEGCSVFDASVVGIFAIVTVSLLTNFVVGINAHAVFVIIGIGIASWIVAACKSRASVLPAMHLLLAFMVFLLVWSTRLIRFSPSYDAGLYHIQYMSWISAAPAPFGLANLEGRLGFNSVWLLFNAALRTPLLGWEHLKIAELAVWSTGSCIVLERVLRVWRMERKHELPTLVALAIVCAPFAWAIGDYGISSTDNVPNLFALLSVVYLADFVAQAKDGTAARTSSSALLHLCCAALAITGKISLAPIALLSVYCLFVLVRKGAVRKAYVLSIAVAIFGGAWLIRGVILSGCVLYPVPFTCIDAIPWAVNENFAAAVKNDIVGWARQPGSDYLAALTGTDWIPSWAARMSNNIIVRVGAIVVVSAVAGMLLLRRIATRSGNLAAPSRFDYSLGAIGGFGLVLWLLAAPDPRFSWAFFALVAVPPVAACIRALDAQSFVHRVMLVNRMRYYRAFVIVFLCVLLIYYLMRFSFSALSMPIPSPETRETRLPSGITIRQPASGDQCWNTPIPCTPTSIDTLIVDNWLGRLRFRRDN